MTSVRCVGYLMDESVRLKTLFLLCDRDLSSDLRALAASFASIDTIKMMLRLSKDGIQRFICTSHRRHRYYPRVSFTRRAITTLSRGLVSRGCTRGHFLT